jgi:hypothetical protein
MDGPRFDGLARSLATSGSRRGFLGGLLGLGAALLGGGRAGAACLPYGRPCNAGDACCNGSECQGGVCRCPAGSGVCNTINGPLCLTCPPDQLVAAGCRCLCKVGGQPPVGGVCPCPPGLTRCGAACVDTQSDPANCGGCGAGCDDGNECTTDACGGGTCAHAAATGAACNGGTGACDASGQCVPNDPQGTCADGADFCASTPGNFNCNGNNACTCHVSISSGTTVCGIQVACNAGCAVDADCGAGNFCVNGATQACCGVGTGSTICVTPCPAP